VITIGGCSYVEIIGLEITQGRTGIETHYGDNDHITIKDCHIHHFGNVGIRIASGKQTYFKCIHNHIHHTGVHGEGFYIGDNPGDTKGIPNPEHCEFVNNWIHNTCYIKNSGNQGDGIELKSGCRSNIIRNNVIHDTKYPCLTLWGTAGGTLEQNNQVYDNVLIHSLDAVVQVTGETDIFNNIIIGSRDTVRKGLSIEENLVSGTRLRLARVFNNTIINLYARISNKVNLSDSSIFMNNAIYAAKGEGVRFMGRIDTTAYSSFAGNISYGTPWVTGDTIPGFIRSTQGFSAFLDSLTNFYPRVNSELKGRGVNLSYVGANAQRDFNGFERGQVWDVGAYQFNPLSAVNTGWILKDYNGGFMDTLLTGPISIEAFFSSFDKADEPLSITVSPNPFKNNTSISFKGLSDAKLYNPTKAIFLGVYNIRGQLVENLTQRLLISGSSGIVWKPYKLRQNHYFIKLTIGNQAVSKQITID
ncbi:MAG: hypothetical protein JNL74_13735, partial [Fibrobacteres bacterium]|nr:hypothetical protein [Fibrobacterota bacterium]